MRVDKWLWAARFFKTRSLAQTAVEGGKIRLNGERVKPAKEVRTGDRLEIAAGGAVWEVTVAGLSDKRGPAAEARKLFEESESSRLKRIAEAESRRLAAEPASSLAGRPTKRDRRTLAKLRGY